METSPITAFLQDADRDGSKFFTPYFKRLFSENGAADIVRFASNGSGNKDDAVRHVINLGTGYRLSKKLAIGKGGGFSVYDGIDFDRWAAIRKNGGKLIFDMSIECFFPRDEIVSGVFEGAEEHGIDPSDIIILNSNRRARSVFEDRRHALGLPAGPELVDINACYWLIKGHNQLTSSSRPAIEARLAQAEAARTGERPKKFVSFNGRLRRHRLFLVLWMLAKGHLDDGFVSLLGYAVGKSPDFEEASRLIARYPAVRDIIEHLPELLRRIPLDLDVALTDSQKDAAYIKSLPWLSPAPHFYDESYFSIVADTSFDDADTLFLTPIAYKSFMNLSPFIYTGNAGALGEMRRLGFQTFAPFIDESYDLIENHGQRMAAVIAELDRLLTMSKAELADLHAALWPRLVHNYWTFHALDPERFANEVIRPLTLPNPDIAR